MTIITIYGITGSTISQNKEFGQLVEKDTKKVYLKFLKYFRELRTFSRPVSEK